MKILRDNGLTITLLLLFGASIFGQWLTGWHVSLEDAVRHGRGAETLWSYGRSAEFLSSVFENWESEFLQMSAYVILTALLFQRGSAESKDPDEPARRQSRSTGDETGGTAPLAPGSLLTRSICAIVGLGAEPSLPAVLRPRLGKSARAAAEEAMEHGEQPLAILAYLGDAQLWFESFQNWQSEFLSTALLIVLSIFLRQRESPESKAVAAPHAQTGNAPLTTLSPRRWTASMAIPKRPRIAPAAALPPCSPVGRRSVGWSLPICNNRCVHSAAIRRIVEPFWQAHTAHL